MKKDKVLQYLIYAGIAFYILLCVLHLASGRPLWLDERFVVDNLQSLRPHQIFGPLQNSQGFPRVYLFLMQKIGITFGYTVFNLRTLPFIFMILSFFIWLGIFKKEKGSSVAYLLFILSFCGSHFTTYYAAEVKQYSADLFAAGLFVYFLLSQKETLSKEKINPIIILQYILLPILLLFSYTAYFFILLPFYNLLLRVKNKKNLIYLAVYVASLFTFIYLSYNFDIKYTMATGDMRLYWNDYYISTSSFLGFLSSFTEGLRNIFVKRYIITKPVKYIMTVFLPFALYAIFYNAPKEIKDKKGLIVSLKTVTPILLIALFVAGVFKIYPFTGGRVTLFMSGVIFYAMIEGIERWKRFYLVYRPLLWLYSITVILCSIYLLRKYILLF